VSDDTAVIDMRAPATASLPVILPSQPRHRAPAGRRKPIQGPGLVEVAAHATGWGTLVVLVVRWVFTLPVV
jgi:hypothetical protein